MVVGSYKNPDAVAMAQALTAAGHKPIVRGVGQRSAPRPRMTPIWHLLWAGHHYPRPRRVSQPDSEPGGRG